MSHVLLADTANGAIVFDRILRGHDCVMVSTLRDAEANLESIEFELIVVSLHFDESKMFELMRLARSSQKNATTPIVCICSRRTQMSQLMHQNLEVITKAMGAWMYVSDQYNVQTTEAKVQRLMERCIADGRRLHIQEHRVAIQKQRMEVQKARLQLQGLLWSPQLQEVLEELNIELDMLLKETERLQLSVNSQRAIVKLSEDMNDGVSDQVRKTERSITDTERDQLADESRQCTVELNTARVEAIRELDAESQSQSGQA
jgi:DNA-binding response OmpR family regulator